MATSGLLTYVSRQLDLQGMNGVRHPYSKYLNGESLSEFRRFRPAIPRQATRNCQALVF